MNLLKPRPIFCLMAKSRLCQGCVSVVSVLYQSYDKAALELHRSEVKARRDMEKPKNRAKVLK